MIEEMVAASIVTLSVFAITATSVATFKSYDRQRTISAMVELENKLIGSLNSQQVQLTIRDSLVKGQVPAGTSITVKDLAADGSSVSSLVGTVGTQVYFSRKDIAAQNGLKNCTPSASDRDCIISTEIDFFCQNTTYASIDMNNPAPVSFFTCSAAYRIYAPGFDTLGAKSLPKVAFVLPSTNSVGDYTVPIAFESTSRTLQDNCDASTDHPNNLFAVGYDRNTGKLICAQRVDPNNPGTDYCAKNQIANEVVFDKTRNILKYSCVTLRGLSCPQNYVLQKFSLLSLRTEGKGVGSCVFIGADSAPFIKVPPVTPTISAQFCPKNYHISAATCAPAQVTSIPGTCYYSYDCDDKGQNCKTGSYQSVNAGGATQPAINGTGTSCSLINPGGQSCAGAYWHADGVSITGTCTLNSDVPKTMPAIPL